MGRHKTVPDEQLLEQARQVFLEHGAFGSTKDIARRTGISESTLFQRYPTKAGLFLAAMVPPQVDIAAIMGDCDARPDVREALVGVGARMLVYFRQVIPVFLQLMAHPSISIADVAAHFERTPPQALTGALAGFLERAAARGQAGGQHHLAAAGLFISAIHSLPLFELMGVHGGDSMDHLVQGFVDALWDGIGPRAASTDALAP